MFQDMNVAKSAPSALLTIYQKSMYPPQSSQKAHVSANYAKFADQFSIGPREVETSSFTANCAKFAQFANHHGESREIRAILANFYHSLLFKCTPTFYSKSRKIRPIR